MDHFNAQEIANTAWVLATCALMSQTRALLVTRWLTNQRMVYFNVQDIANTVWALAMTGLTCQA